MLPFFIFVAVALPLLVIAFVALRRRTTAAEHPPGETEADRRRVEREFEAAERYQARLRAQERKHPHDPPVP